MCGNKLVSEGKSVMFGEDMSKYDFDSFEKFNGIVPTGPKRLKENLFHECCGKKYDGDSLDFVIMVDCPDCRCVEVKFFYNDDSKVYYFKGEKNLKFIYDEKEIKKIFGNNATINKWTIAKKIDGELTFHDLDTAKLFVCDSDAKTEKHYEKIDLDSLNDIKESLKKHIEKDFDKISIPIPTRLIDKAQSSIEVHEIRRARSFLGLRNDNGVDYYHGADLTLDEFKILAKKYCFERELENILFETCFDTNKRLSFLESEVKSLRDSIQSAGINLFNC